MLVTLMRNICAVSNGLKQTICSGLRSSILTYAGVCWRMLAHAGVCWRMLAYAGVCWRMLTYADVCCQQRAAANDLL